MDTNAADTQGHSLGDVIVARRDAIIRAWEAAVLALPMPSNLPGPLLRDEMPEVVDQIAELVSASRVPPSHPSEPAEKHALQRLGIGFELAHLLMEYSVLRNCIVEATAQHVTLALADYIALNRAIDTVANRSVQRFSEASERLLKALDQISAEALESRNLDELLRRLLNVMMNTSRAVDSVAILLEENGILKVRAAAGVIAERDPGFTIAVGEGFSGAIAASCEPRLSRSAAHDPVVRSEFIKLRGIRALYGVPLIDDGCIGVAHMGSLTVHDFTQEEKLLFQAMVTRATTAIVNTLLLERLEAEHGLLVSTVGQMPMGVIIRDASGHLLVANEAAERIMQAEIATSLPSEDSQRIEDWALSHALHGGELVREERTLRSADGTTRTIEVSAVPIRGHDGAAVVAGVAVFEDVTDRREAERERDLYISSMSHDLRTPLSVIELTATTLQRQADATASDGKALARIATNARRMDLLIRQLLDFARSRHGGGIPITRRPTDLVELSRQLIDSLQTDDGSRVELDAVPSVTGSWDPDRLAQLLQNLIANARQHGRRDAPIEVQVTCDDDTATIRVTNASVSPIPASLLPHIFDPFRRGSESGALGLGLYICQQIARAHQADIAVSSDAQRTTFTVRLPRR